MNDDMRKDRGLHLAQQVSGPFGDETPVKVLELPQAKVEAPPQPTPRKTASTGDLAEGQAEYEAPEETARVDSAKASGAVRSV